MRKNRTMRLAALLLALTLITSCFVGGTFAKYTSTATGSDTATVAAWSFIVNGDDIATSETFTFQPFFNYQQDKIAPGASGSCYLSLTNKSDVDAHYTVTFAVSATDADGNPVTNIPLQFKGDTGSYATDISNLDIDPNFDLTPGEFIQHSFNWQWPMDGNDAVDAAFGSAAKNVTITATVTATQANP